MKNLDVYLEIASVQNKVDMMWTYQSWDRDRMQSICVNLRGSILSMSTCKLKGNKTKQNINGLKATPKEPVISCPRAVLSGRYSEDILGH